MYTKSNTYCFRDIVNYCILYEKDEFTTIELSKTYGKPTSYYQPYIISLLKKGLIIRVGKEGKTYVYIFGFDFKRFLKKLLDEGIVKDSNLVEKIRKLILN